VAVKTIADELKELAHEELSAGCAQDFHLHSFFALVAVWREDGRAAGDLIGDKRP